MLYAIPVHGEMFVDGELVDGHITKVRNGSTELRWAGVKRLRNGQTKLVNPVLHTQNFVVHDGEVFAQAEQVLKAGA